MHELWDVRIDHNFNDNHRVFGRFSYRNDDRARSAFLPFPARASSISAFRTKQFSLNYNATLSSRIHNEFRGGFSRFPASRTDEHTENLNQKFGIPNALVEQYPERAQDPQHQTGLVGFAYNNIYNGVGGGGGTISGRLDTMTIADNLLWDFGKHSFKLGVELRRWDNLRSQLFGSDLGKMSFDGRYTAQFPNLAQGPGSRRLTGHAIADSLLGWSRRTSTGLPIGEDMHIPYWGFYVQDDWRVTPRLTLNLGLRYELFMQPRINLGSGAPELQGELDIRHSPARNWGHHRCPASTAGCFQRAAVIVVAGWTRMTGHLASESLIRVTGNTVIRTGGGLYYSENSTAGIESNRFNAGGPVATFSTTDPMSFEVPAAIRLPGVPSFRDQRRRGSHGLCASVRGRGRRECSRVQGNDQCLPVVPRRPAPVALGHPHDDRLQRHFRPQPALVASELCRSDRAGDFTPRAIVPGGACRKIQLTRTRCFRSTTGPSPAITC